MNINNYLITGASGFIGKKVCEKLKEQNHEVYAIVKKHDPYLEFIGVKIIIGDLENKETLNKIPLETSCVIHCAGNAKFGNGENYKTQNTNLSNFLIKTIIENFEEKPLFIFISSIGAIDRGKKDNCESFLNEDSVPYPSSDYGLSKLKTEEILKKSSLPYVIIRPSMVVGENMRRESHFSFFAEKCLRNNIFSYFSWPGKLSVIDVSDLADAIIFVSNNKKAVNETFFCAGSVISIEDFFNKCLKKRFRISGKLIYLILGMIRNILPFSLKILIFSALTASDLKLRKLGWEPKVSLDETTSKIIVREKSRINPESFHHGLTVISGAASGLGKALALKLYKKREKLLLIDKDERGLKELKKKIENAFIKTVDLTEENEVEELIKSVEWNNRNIVEFYACAGIGFRGSVDDLDYEKHEKMFKLNVLSRIFLAKNIISRMRRAHFGRIILISSSSAFQAMPLMATYAATNSALLNLGIAWSQEERKNNLDIFTVCPGGMDTNFQKTGGVRENEKLMSPNLVAEKILSGIKKNMFLIVISLRSHGMNIFSKILPRKFSVVLWFYLMKKLR